MTEPVPEHPRSFPPDLPASGAWRPGDPVGERQFVTIAADHPFALEGRRHPRPSQRRLRDVGRARRHRQQRGARVPRAHRRLARGGSPRPRSPDPRLVGRPDRAGQAARHRPVLRRVRERARRLPGHHRPVLDRPGRPACRGGSRFPVVTIRDMVRAQARVGRPPRCPVAGSRVIGGSMGGMQVDRVGGHVPASRAVVHEPRELPAGERVADRVERGGRTALALDPNGAVATTTTRRPATARTAGLAVARQIAQITYRSDPRVPRPLRSRARRPARRVPHVGPLPGRELPRLPRRQAGAPLRRELVPRAQQGDGPPRRRPRSRRRRGRRGAREGAVARRVDHERRAVPDVPADRAARRRSSRTGCAATTTSSTARKATTGSCSRPSRSDPSWPTSSPTSRRARRPGTTMPDDPTDQLHPETVAIRAGRKDNDTALAPILWATTHLRHADGRRRPAHGDARRARTASTRATATPRCAASKRPSPSSSTQKTHARSRPAWVRSVPSCSACARRATTSSRRSSSTPARSCCSRACARASASTSPSSTAPSPARSSAAVRPGKTTLIFAETPANPRLSLVDLDEIARDPGPDEGRRLDVRHAARATSARSRHRPRHPLRDQSDRRAQRRHPRRRRGEQRAAHVAVGLRGAAGRERVAVRRDERAARPAHLGRAAAPPDRDRAAARRDARAPSRGLGRAATRASSRFPSATWPSDRWRCPAACSRSTSPAGSKPAGGSSSRCEIAQLATSLGGPETLVTHPASTTHVGLLPEELADAGISPGTIRVSAGLEHADDLLDDFRQALAASTHGASARDPRDRVVPRARGTHDRSRGRGGRRARRVVPQARARRGGARDAC